MNNDFKSLKEWKLACEKASKDGTLIEIGKKFDYQSKRNSKHTIFTKHGPLYLPIIFDVIRKYNPSLFIELGTFQGGLTLAINEEFPEIKLVTYDRLNHVAMKTKEIFHGEVRFMVEDILTVPSQSLIDFLTLDEKKILYCDNGNKTKEINTYGQYLNSGDVIGCHDWLVEVNPEDVEKSLSGFQLVNELERSFFLCRFWEKF